MTNLKLLAIQIGDELKYDTTLKEINRIAGAIFDFECLNFPNDNITSVRAQLVYDWVMTLDKQEISEEEKLSLLNDFIDGVAPEEHSVRRLLNKNFMNFQGNVENFTLRDINNPNTEIKLSLEVKGHIQRCISTIFSWDKLYEFGTSIGVETKAIREKGESGPNFDPYWTKKTAAAYIMDNANDDVEIILRTLILMSKKGTWNNDYSERVVEELNPILEKTMKMKIDAKGQIEFLSGQLKNIGFDGRNRLNERYDSLESSITSNPPKLLPYVSQIRFDNSKIISQSDYEFDIAVSFAGEDRDIVENYVSLLKSKGLTVFYDKENPAKHWGKNLIDEFHEIYTSKALYCVMFISKHYLRKSWTNHERQAAQERALNDKKEYILPIRLDDTEIPGLPSTIGYLDLRELGIDKIASITVDKLRKQS